MNLNSTNSKSGQFLKSEKPGEINKNEWKPRKPRKTNKNDEKTSVTLMGQPLQYFCVSGTPCVPQ
jgi:hypothetical protein